LVIVNNHILFQQRTENVIRALSNISAPETVTYEK